MRPMILWAAITFAAILPIGLSLTSPLLAWRDATYITAGLAGILAMVLLLAQPLLIGGHLPGLSARLGRRGHRWVGAALLASICIHVGGLWITSPPDMIDALTFSAPTLFSHLGVVAMWALFAAAFFAAVRPRLRLRTFRALHTAAALACVAASALHAFLIDGTMEALSKTALCAAVVFAAVWVIARRTALNRR